MQVQRRSDIEEDDFDFSLEDLEVPEFNATERIEQKLRKEQKQQRTLERFIKDVCSC